MNVQTQTSQAKRHQRPPRVANYSQRRAIEDLMLRHSKPSPDASYRIWDDGWSYRRAATEVHTAFDAGYAQRIAQSLGIRFLPPQVPNTVVLSKLAEQELRIVGLQESVTELTRQLRDMLATRKAA